jgi:hypothetical protein
MSRLLILCVAAFFMLSCANSKKTEQNTLNSQFTQCQEDRPQICTREYLPVCATRDTGIRCVAAPCPSSEQRTYGNACTACADEKVAGYKPEACTSEPDAR